MSETTPRTTITRTPEGPDQDDQEPGPGETGVLTALAVARTVADTILYEGAPPRRGPEPASDEDAMRLQFGVLMPPAYSGPEHSEFSDARTELLLDAEPETRMLLHLRFLHVQHLGVEVRTDEHTYLEVPSLTVEDTEYSSWDEAIERQVTVAVSVSELLDSPIDVPFECPVEDTVEPIRHCEGTGRLRRRMERLGGELRITGRRLSGVGSTDGLVRVRVDIVNTTRWSAYLPDRVEALRRALMSAHLVATVDGGRFLSLLDPPAWAEHAARSCVGVRMWPVLIGETGRDRAVLASPVILYDHPSPDCLPDPVLEPGLTPDPGSDLDRGLSPGVDLGELIPDQQVREEPTVR